ncbi:Get3/ArsA fold putative tail anchor-mediating ATPase NosAFP [Oscillatoria salina]|uniref:Get3/ArsA fold putative tail anchor-mediating ATPase NosAFP n=1 Tax=Oscillatoria salina TaxID=331517 RepID=UPI0013BA65C1|nr:ArsA family ATPase [Oscillatoria salina]MBZ8178500.1 ArsA family ATPase [Oscillatoria salina IIICB1]NET88004.1 ArsA family ATPase [Kamptonema sp. SIO1D9]
MAQILTFLGKGGTGRTTVAIAAAKQLAASGSRTLLVSSDSSPAFGILLGLSPGAEPQEIAANLSAVQLQATVLLENSWEEVKKLEAKYLRSPTLKNVYGQELSVLPGMDGALALNAIREYNASGKYDAIVYDGTGDLQTLRVLGIPETASWYFRRFRQVFIESDLGKAIAPFIQPVSSAVLNVTWTADNFAPEPTNQATSMLEDGKAAIADPHRVLAYLVTTDDPSAIATAKYLWGSAQQINLSVGGVLLNQADTTAAITKEFAPLAVTSLPRKTADWQPLLDALPSFKPAAQIPKPVTIDLAARQVKIFLPGFDKKQVKLTQYGPEITVEAGNQRRNITLPPPLSGQPVKGAKFQDGYLIVSL